MRHPSHPTIVSLALRSPRLACDADQQLIGGLEHLLLDWAPRTGWTIECWGLRSGRRTIALDGRYRVRGPSVPPIENEPISFLFAWLTHLVLAFRSRRHSPTIVVQFPLLGLGVALLRRIGGLRGRLCVRIVGRTSSVTRDVRHQPARAWMIDRLEAFVLRQADVVLTLSPFTTGLAERAGVPKARIVPAPYPAGDAPTEVPSVLEASRVTILWSGQLIPTKGVETLIQAFADLGDLDRLQLRIAGDGPERPRLQHLADRLGVADQVRFLGWLDRQDLAAEQRAADIAVLPSRTDEGLGRSLVEGGVHGCVPIATAPGGTQDVIDDEVSGLLVPRNDHTALSGAFRRCVEQPALARRLATEAHRRCIEIYEQRDRALVWWQAYLGLGQDRRRIAGPTVPPSIIRPRSDDEAPPRAPDGASGSPVTVDVIIPTRDRPRTVPTAVASALAQSRPPGTIWVVDDGSEPPLTLPSELALDARVRMLRQEEGSGAAAARNLALRRSVADLVAFLDDDDVWRPDFLERTVETFLASPEELDVLEVGASHFDGVHRPYLNIPDPGRDIARDLLFGPVACTVLARRSRLLAVGGFDPSLQRTEDWDLWTRVADRGRFHALAEVLVDREPAGTDSATAQRTTHEMFERLAPRTLELSGRDRKRWTAHRQLVTGVLRNQGGDRAGARRAMIAAWRSDPRQIRPLIHLGRTVVGERLWSAAVRAIRR